MTPSAIAGSKSVGSNSGSDVGLVLPVMPLAFDAVSIDVFLELDALSIDADASLELGALSMDTAIELDTISVDADTSLKLDALSIDADVSLELDGPPLLAEAVDCVAAASAEFAEAAGASVVPAEGSGGTLPTAVSAPGAFVVSAPPSPFVCAPLPCAFDISFFAHFLSSSFLRSRSSKTLLITSRCRTVAGLSQK